MGYSLGIDLGTTYTAAAVVVDGRAEVVSLGNHAATIPSEVFLREDGDVIVGDVAHRRGQQEPGRLAREFKRRFGDATPIMLGHTPYSAERLMAAVLEQTIAEVSERYGGPPDAVAIAHPANWGPYKIELLGQATQLAGLRDVRYVTEPEAAAVHYAAGTRLADGDAVAVYDLGGGTFDAAVLQRTADGFATLGEPQGIERLGGIDFDQAVLSHVRETVGDALDGLDPTDPASRAALQRLREECVAAKEALSDDSSTSIDVTLPGLQTQVRLTRTELEDAIRPALRETVLCLTRAIEGAGLGVSGVKAVVLAGGSSRIPLVKEMVGALGVPVVLDAHPKHTVALGAAILASSPAGGLPVGATAPVLPAAVVAATIADEPPPPAPPAPPVEPPPLPTPTPDDNTGGGRGRGKVVALVLVLLALIGGGAAFALGGGGDDDAATTTSAAPTTTAGVATPGAVETTTTTTVAAPTCASSSGRCAVLDEVAYDGDQLTATYETIGFEPLIAGSDSDHHLHFFFDTVPLDQAGVPGNGPWIIWDVDSQGAKIFHDGPEAITRDEVPADATQLCVVVATHHHALDTDPIPSCLALP